MKNSKMLKLAAGTAVALATFANAQTFNRIIGTGANETANGIAPTRDGGYVTVGSISSATGADRGDILVIKYLPDGSIQWVSRFGGPGYDVGYSVKQTSDGGYIVGAETDSVGPLLNMALLRLDPAGGYMWSSVYEGDQSSEDVLNPNGGVGVAEIIRDSSHPNETPGFVLVGRKAVGNGYQAGVIVRTNAAGAAMFNIRYTDTRYSERNIMTLTDVKIDADHSIVVTGTDALNTTATTPDRDAMVMRVNSSTGAMIWARTYPLLIPGTNSPDRGNGDGLAISDNRDIIVDGRCDTGNATQNYQAMRLDSLGNIRWFEVFNRQGSSFRSVQEDPNAKILLSGWLGTFPTASSAMLTLLDPAGGVIFQHKYQYLITALGSTPTPANPFYALCGTVNLPTTLSFGGTDIELIHTDGAGFVGCLEGTYSLAPVRYPVNPVNWQAALASQVSTFWQAPFTRWDMRDVPLCIQRPCPVCAADFNEDGGIDGDDINAFFQAWEAGESCADVNEDGGIDGDDIRAFFRLWENGGC